MTRNIILSALVFFMGIAVTYFAYYGMVSIQNSMTAIEPAAGGEEQSDTVIGGDFTLIDENGNPVTQADYDDRYKLVFFGFTACPDVCPAGMQKMDKTMDELGDDSANITPLFITIDPRRDTPEVMKEYTDMYDERIIGLTGDETQITAMEDAFKVYAAKIDGDDPDYYMYAHSAYVYLTDKDNKLVTVFGPKDVPADMAAEIRKYISGSADTL